MCTRATYLGLSDTVITARSLDWATPLPVSLVVLPRGLRRDGAAGANSVQWESRFGSLVVCGYDGTAIDGMNERGLVANVLYLSESDYGKQRPHDPRQTMSVAAWGQYALDNFATVAEAVQALRQDAFLLVPLMTPDGHPATVHLALGDPSGDSAIVEYIDGELRIHHGRQYQVMTNSPAYDQQLALNAYWEAIGGTVMLPGTSRAADRFARASFYITAIPQTDEIPLALASAFGVIRGVSVPLGISTPGQPNIAATRWRVVSDLKNRTYYYESAQSPYLLWINLADLDFSAGAPVLKLALNQDAAWVDEGVYQSGNALAALQPAEPYQFLPA